MGRTYESLEGRLGQFLLRQPVFFVATAPLSSAGHVNCSPKGNDGGLVVLGPQRIAYQDLTGSGSETMAHLRENGRIVVMFCAFDGPPRIVRIHGRGRVVVPGDQEWEDLASRFPPKLGMRSVIVVDAERISDSCGYAVPLMNFESHRSNLDHWAEEKGPEGLVAYRAEKNALSLDGLAALPEFGDHVVTMQPSPVGLDEIDLSDIEFWSRPPEFREGAFLTLRQQRPMGFFNEPEMPPEVPMPQGPGYWAVTRHADIVEASRRPEVFSSARGATSVQDMPEMFLEYFGSMINLDDPRHGRLRRIVSAGFTPRMLKKLEEDVQRAAGEIVDDLLVKGECDFVTDVAARLPLKIICDMMGIGPSDYETVFNASNIILSAGDPEYMPEGADPLSTLLGAATDLTNMVQDLGRARRGSPTEDLTSALVNAEVEGETLTDAELGSFFILLVVAGNETTRNAISHTLVQLTEHPDQRDRLAADFDSLASGAVEEIVRWASPVIWMRRSATEDAVLGDAEIKAGDKLLLFYASANRDAEVFDDPFRFDIGRNPNPHVGFGGPGPHFCLGAHLARREITVMLRELLTRVPAIRATSEPDRLRSNFINGIKHLECSIR